MIDQLTTDDLDGLVDGKEPPCVSLYVPMERKGAETQQNPLLLKSALKEAHEKLVEGGMRRPDAEGLLKPVEELIDDYDYLQNQEAGLALFLDGSGLGRYRLPIEFEQLVVVGERFHIKPLLPFLSADGEFYVLALSHNEVRLLRGSHWRVSEVELTDIPHSLRDALWYKKTEPALQAHHASVGGAPRGALTFHGQGLGEKSSEEDRKEFFRQVDSGVTSLVDNETPVVLAGVEYLHPLYHQVTDLNVLEKGIEGNPDELGAAELHNQAWQLVSEVFNRQRREAEERIGAADTSSSLDDILMGAIQGRIDVLFVPRGEQRWGRVDRDTLEIELDGADGESDLYDIAAMETWRHRGDVYVVDRDEMPGEGEIAAVFRF